MADNKVFFSVVVVFRQWENDNYIVNRYRFLNCDVKMVHQLRRQIVNEGIQVCADSLTSWLVILPWMVVNLEVHQQKKYFNYEHSSIQQTVFSAEGEKI